MFFFSVAPTVDGWVCKRGARLLGTFPDVAEAMQLAELEASVYRPSEVSLHDEDGHVEVVSRFAQID